MKKEITKKELEEFIVDNFYLWNNKEIGWQWEEDYSDWKGSKKLKAYFKNVLKNRKDALK